MTPRAAGVARAALVGLVCLQVVACSGESAQGLTIFTWWSEKGERQALNALLDSFVKEHPKYHIQNLHTTTSNDARQTIAEFMNFGQPQLDTFQANGGWDLFKWITDEAPDEADEKYSEADSKMQSIDDLFAASLRRDDFRDDVLKTVKCGNNGLFAVPLDMHRVNTLYYNKSLIPDADRLEDRLTDVGKLLDLAEELQGNSQISPFALGSKEPWTLSLLLFENLLVADSSTEIYGQLFSGSSANVGVEVRQAVSDSVAHLKRLLQYVNRDAPNLRWDQSVDLVAEGNAAMVIMGDWATGHLKAKYPPKMLDNIGRMPMPGTAGRVFVFTTDTLGLPKRAANPEAVKELLLASGGEDGQMAFNRSKGSIPARLRPDTSGAAESRKLEVASVWDDVWPDYSATLPALASTAILAHPRFMEAVNDALARFASTRPPELAGPDAGPEATYWLNESYILHTIENYYDLLRNSWQRRCDPKTNEPGNE